MISLTLALCLSPCFLSTPKAPETFLLTPSDDIWVYPHASEGAKDAYLRIWGTDGRAAANKGEAPDEFSYAYLVFDLSSLPKNAKLTQAVLTVTQTPDPGFAASDAKAAPIEVRALSGEFSEKKWDYGQATAIAPDAAKTAILGSGFPEKWDAGKPIPIEINLMPEKGGFPALFAKLMSSAKPSFSCALTSRIDPSSGGRSFVYKLYSKEGSKELLPVLKIVLERQ